MAARSNKSLDMPSSQWRVKLNDKIAHKHSPTYNDALYEELVHGKSVEVEVYSRKGLQERLKEWRIHTETIEHPEVVTTEQALPYVSKLEGMFTKNLFLRDSDWQLYLFCAAHDATITLHDLAKLVGAPGGFRLVGASLIERKLGLKHGVVTVFGLINDQFHDVKLILDSTLVDGTYSKVMFHPMVNCATTAISPDGLNSFLDHTGHVPMLIEFLGSHL